MLQSILLVVLIFICIALVGVILLQRSEGGALGTGGGPSGFMSTRGAGDLLTRTTAILAAVFFILCLSLTVIMGRAHKGQSVVDRLKIDALDPAALSRRPTPTPTTTPNATAPVLPILEAPKPQVQVAPSAPARRVAPAAVKPAPAAAVAPAPAPAASAPAAAAPANTAGKP